MPRRSINNSDESPAPRRQSARIAAVQTASPAKSPAKSPRRKRKSVDTKGVTDDSESQQSHLKSESSMEELNGIETSPSAKDQESVSDSQELPSKKAKVDEVDSECIDEVDPSKEFAEPNPLEKVAEISDEKPVDFEVVEKSDVPASDSIEVEAAVAVQGDGQLLIGFVQVDKEELPSAAVLEAQQVAVSDESANAAIDTCIEETPIAEPAPEQISNATHEKSMNGDSHESCPALTDNTSTVVNPTTCEVQTKLCPIEDIPAQPSSTLAAGDSTANMVSIEAVPQ